MIFDTHCHLNSPELYERIDEVINNAKSVNVTRFLVVGWNIESSMLAIELAHKYDFIYAAIGVHPTDIEGVSDSQLDDLFKNLGDPKVVAVGEIGLDYYWVKDEQQRINQQRYFAKQIEYANKYKKPISIHNRDAFEDCLNVLKTHKPMYGGIMHCYAGSVESLNEVTSLGLLIGLGGPLTFTNAKKPKEVCKAVDINKLVVETDSPYLAPHPLRGTTNEPANIKLIVEEVANLKNLSVFEVEEATFKNANKLLGIK